MTTDDCLAGVADFVNNFLSTITVQENGRLQAKMRSDENEISTLQKKLEDTRNEMGISNIQEKLSHILKERDALLEYLEEHINRMQGMERVIQDLAPFKERCNTVEACLEVERSKYHQTEKELQRCDVALQNANKIVKDRTTELENFNRSYEDLALQLQREREKESQSRDEEPNEVKSLRGSNCALLRQVEQMAKMQLDLQRSRAQVLALEIELKEKRKESVHSDKDGGTGLVSTVASSQPEQQFQQDVRNLYEQPVLRNEDRTDYGKEDRWKTVANALLQLEVELGQEERKEHRAEATDAESVDFSWAFSPALHALSAPLANKVRITWEEGDCPTHY